MSSIGLCKFGPCLSIIVYGIARPKGSLRHVGKHRLVEQCEHGPAWRTAVKDAARAAMDRQVAVLGISDTGGGFPLDGPLSVYLTITCNKPASASKSKPSYPCTRSTGDIDKLQRNIFDALVDAGAIADDSRIVEVRARKCYPGQLAQALDTAGTHINIYKVGDPE